MLDSAGLKIVTVSTDTPQQITMGHTLHGLQATMLADPKLDVTNLFGYRNKNLNNFKTPGRPGLPVPTTLIVDRDGTILWKDQSDNYTRRSDPDYVRAALADQFPESGAAPA